MKERTPRVDWAELLRRTFDFDVLACARCGGRRSVPQGGCTVSAPVWRIALGLPSAAFLCLSAPIRCPRHCPNFSYAPLGVNSSVLPFFFF
jgi:hypothetical protein